MPGFAGAKPGTGQTARAIIAPASCRHDNCFAHCLINAFIRPCLFACFAGSTPAGLYIAPLRPLPAGNPAGPALHNEALCKLARANDEPHAANAATALKGTRPASCRGGRAPAAPAASPPPHLPPPGKPFGLPQVAAMPSCLGQVSALVIYCHSSDFLSIIVSVAASSGHCVRVPNGSKGTV